jgi:hypothetical protein
MKHPLLPFFSTLMPTYNETICSSLGETIKKTMDWLGPKCLIQQVNCFRVTFLRKTFLAYRYQYPCPYCLLVLNNLVLLKLKSLVTTSTTDINLTCIIIK